ncbi:hypothetical protein C8F04DRAFT_1143902 [Mycena alexandri]|uniref:Uncharacterized protein n=1 Tax=Mycena alexandri TaxID=1745969 RepID=A0AAD6S555_9AGAR|nr:hypothetical protein C8F04DRAFT_1143902 [Mycena alexandri]
MSSLSSSTTGAATPSAPSSPSVPPPPPLSSSSPSQPSTSAAPPPSSAPAPPSSTSSSQSSSSSITSAPSSPTSASVTQSQVIHKSTDSTGGVVTQTQTTQVTLSAAPSGSAASGVRTTSKGCVPMLCFAFLFFPLVCVRFLVGWECRTTSSTKAFARRRMRSVFLVFLRWSTSSHHAHLPSRPSHLPHLHLSIYLSPSEPAHPCIARSSASNRPWELRSVHRPIPSHT